MMSPPSILARGGGGGWWTFCRSAAVGPSRGKGNVFASHPVYEEGEGGSKKGRGSQRSMSGPALLAVSDEGGEGNYGLNTIPTNALWSASRPGGGEGKGKTGEVPCASSPL